MNLDATTRVACAYYNVSSAIPTNVHISMYGDALSIVDLESEEPKEIYFPYTECRYVKLEEQAFVYLQSSYTSYLVLPVQHPQYLELLSKISSKQTSWFQKLYKKNGAALFLAFLIAAAAMLFIGYKTVPPLLVRFIPVREEIKWGNQFYESILSDKEIDSSATELVKKITEHYSMSNQYPIKIAVVEDTTVNAFAMPGGHIVIYSGIISTMKHPDELFALLGHEATHVNQRHSLQMMLTNLTSSYLLSILTSDFNGLGSTLIGNAELLRELGYSRKLEAEADWKGQEIMIQNKVNPAGMTQLMEALQAAYSDNGNWSFLRSHPVTKDRISESKKFSQQHVGSFNSLPAEQQTAWEALKKLYPEKPSSKK
jgi:Zn-dependent protease with chaperone function